MSFERMGAQAAHLLDCVVCVNHGLSLEYMLIKGASCMKSFIERNRHIICSKLHPTPFGGVNK